MIAMMTAHEISTRGKRVCWEYPKVYPPNACSGTVVIRLLAISIQQNISAGVIENRYRSISLFAKRRAG